ncbi:MAG: sensor histidine kinase [Sulfuricurvum sp.]
MKKAERESFLKSFAVFFLSLGSLSILLLYAEYAKLTHDLKETLYNEMKVCSFDLQCTDAGFDFVPLEIDKLNELVEQKKELYALFPIPKNTTYALKISVSAERFDARRQPILHEVLWHAAGALAVIAILSVLFSLYALSPLRRSLRLTEEFSRDILHDLNTPLSALRLNVTLLKTASGEARKMERIHRSIESIVALGDNLRSYLEEHEHQRERIDLWEILDEARSTYVKLFPSVSYVLEGEAFTILGHRDALKRILDNLLSNASKYNRDHGRVNLRLDPTTARLILRDTGKGIRRPDKIFERFYKEHDRGMGIGLNIVKKLCDEMKIVLHVESEIGIGTTIILDFTALKER